LGYKNSATWIQFVKMYFIYAKKNERKSVEEVKELRKYNICLLNVKSILLLLSQRDIT
jgi:hypothetical protein